MASLLVHLNKCYGKRLPMMCCSLLPKLNERYLNGKDLLVLTAVKGSMLGTNLLFPADAVTRDLKEASIPEL